MRGYDLWQGERERAEVLACGMRMLKSNKQDGRPTLMMWRPKATKPFINGYFRSEESREAYIAEQVKNIEERRVRMAQWKAERAGTPEQVEAVKPGDIFLNSWGYDQTNVDYYQVIERHGKVVTLREIGSETVPGSEGFMSSRVKPRRGAFLEKSAPFKKKLCFYGGKPSLSFKHGGGELYTEGQTNYCSWYA